MCVYVYLLVLLRMGKLLTRQERQEKQAINGYVVVASSMWIESSECVKRWSDCINVYTHTHTRIMYNVYACILIPFRCCLFIIFIHIFQHQLVIRSSRANWFHWILPRILIGTFLFALSIPLTPSYHSLFICCTFVFRKCVLISFLIASNFELAVTTVDSSSSQQWRFCINIIGLCLLFIRAPHSHLPRFQLTCAAFSWYRFHASNQAEFQCSNERDCSMTTMQNTHIASTHFLCNAVCVCVCTCMYVLCNRVHAVMIFLKN